MHPSRSENSSQTITYQFDIPGHYLLAILMQDFCADLSAASGSLSHSGAEARIQATSSGLLATCSLTSGTVLFHSRFLLGCQIRSLPRRRLSVKQALPRSALRAHYRKCMADVVFHVETQGIWQAGSSPLRQDPLRRNATSLRRWQWPIKYRAPFANQMWYGSTLRREDLSRVAA